MARSLRVEFEGAWYHVMNRGASRHDVFSPPADVGEFLCVLAAVADRFAIEVHAYCLMHNHYHLLVRTPQANLGRGMRHLNGVYTQRFHRRHGTDGALLRGRYRAIVVEAESHLLHVSRYIHLNPVAAGLVSVAEDWPHSSFHAYLDPAARPRWLRTGAILEPFGPRAPHRRYAEFTRQGVDGPTRDFYDRPGPVLGSEEFLQRVAQRTGPLAEHAARELPGLRRLSPAAALSTILRAVASEFGVDCAALRATGRRTVRELVLARGAFVYIARNRTDLTLAEIAAAIGFSYYGSAAIAALRFDVAISQDPALTALIDRVLQRVVRAVAPPTRGDAENA